MNDAITISKDELRAIVQEAVKDALHDMGLRADEPAHVDEAREDFRFIRRLRKAIDSAAGKVGMAIILALMGGLGWLIISGGKAFLGK